jgi:hypothetical protein
MLGNWLCISVEGYWNSGGVVYVSPKGDEGKTVGATPGVKETWSANWIRRPNQKSHVATNLVHTLWNVPNIGKQPLWGVVSREAYLESEAKHKSSKIIWYTLTQGSLNNFL